jgi:uncharacterized membrane protein
MDNLFKLLHVASVIAFLGNITTGLFWHAHAVRTGNAKILAHTMDGIIRADRIFTLPGVAGIILFGVATAMRQHLPILGTGWIRWTLVLFAISGVTFMARVAPLQRQLRSVAAAGAESGTFDAARYHALARQWELWGAIALFTPLAGLALMVLKPLP